MRTLVSDPPPPEFEALLEQRRRWGADHHDEVWEGVLHMNPAPHGRHAALQMQLYEILGPLARERGLRPRGEMNIGSHDDFRVPDAAILRAGPDVLYAPTAALVLEIVSPGDESWAKLGFYASLGVEEVLVVDAQSRAVVWLGLDSGSYAPLERSTLIELGPGQLSASLEWPE